MDSNKEPENLPLLIWFLGLLKNTIQLWRRNFSKLTLILVLPALCLFFLAQIQAYNDLVRSSHLLYQTAPDTDKWIFFGLFKSLCLVPFLVLSPLPMATAIYYAAVINTNRLELTNDSNKAAANVTFTVWKRLLIVSYKGYVAILSLATLVMVVLAYVARVLAAPTLVSFLEFLYQAGLVYLCMIWQMTMVLSVLDEAYTTKQINYSEVVEEKMWAEATVLFNLIILRSVTNTMMWVWTSSTDGWILLRGIDGVLWISLLSLFAIVLQKVCFYASKLYRLEKFQRWCSLLGHDQDHRQGEACQEDHDQGVSIKVVDVQDEVLLNSQALKG